MAKISKEEFEKGKQKFKDKNKNQPEAIIFDSAAIKEIADKNPKVALYFIEGDDGKNTIAVLGIDSENKLMTSLIEDKGQPCPPYCPS